METTEPITTTKVWVLGGPLRLKILQILIEGPALSSLIAQKVKSHRSSTSRALKELKAKNLVDFVQAGSRTKEYNITGQGKAVLKELEGKR